MSKEVFLMKKLMIAVLVLIILSYGCAQEQEEKPTSSNIQQPPESIQISHNEAPAQEQGEPASVEKHPVRPGTIQVQSSGVKQFDIIAKQWEFIPNEIVANQGDKVILDIKSVDVNHGFMLPDFGVSEFLPPDTQVTIAFIADKVGEFDFSCNVPCGSGHGRMTGKLIVRSKVN